MSNSRKKTYIGKVVSTSMDKTISVEITSLVSVKLYKKKVTRTVKFKAHDENQIAKVGDMVKIVKTRPISKTKHFRLLEVLKGQGKK